LRYIIIEEVEVEVEVGVEVNFNSISLYSAGLEIGAEEEQNKV
jgi:hypothetical protein